MFVLQERKYHGRQITLSRKVFRYLFYRKANIRVDVTEDNENLYVHAEVPGVDKNDIKINLVGDVLTISGEKKSEQKDEKKNYYRIERNYGAFSRSFTLPAEVNVLGYSCPLGVLKSECKITVMNNMKRLW